MNEPISDSLRSAMSKVASLPVAGIDMSGIQQAWEAKRKQELVDLGFANVLYERLVAQIADFQASIQPDEEVAAHLASFGTRVIVLIDRVRFRNPYYIIFDGVNAETGERVRLVQHTSQTSVLLVAAKVQEPRKPRRIGFYVEDDVPEKTGQKEQTDN